MPDADGDVHVRAYEEANQRRSDSEDYSPEVVKMLVSTAQATTRELARLSEENGLLRLLLLEEGGFTDAKSIDRALEDMKGEE